MNDELEDLCTFSPRADNFLSHHPARIPHEHWIVGASPMSFAISPR